MCRRRNMSQKFIVYILKSILIWRDVLGHSKPSHSERRMTKEGILTSLCLILYKRTHLFHHLVSCIPAMQSYSLESKRGIASPSSIHFIRLEREEKCTLETQQYLVSELCRGCVMSDKTVGTGKLRQNFYIYITATHPRQGFWCIYLRLSQNCLVNINCSQLNGKGKDHEYIKETVTKFYGIYTFCHLYVKL